MVVEGSSVAGRAGVREREEGPKTIPLIRTIVIRFVNPGTAQGGPT